MSGKPPTTITPATTSVPSSVTTKINRGVPKRTAMSTGAKPKSMVKVG